MFHDWPKGMHRITCSVVLTGIFAFRLSLLHPSGRCNACDKRIVVIVKKKKHLTVANLNFNVYTLTALLLRNI